MISRRLERKFDRIKEREEKGLNGGKTMNRSLRKFLKNRLAIIGVVLFAVILLASVFAPLLTSYDPLGVDMSSVLEAPS
ncbi:MAG: peptide ABC transporter permease, partial [Clostridia bacterium]|nr:peptide ABC transporter permease [Clostridia bacterium]